MVIMIINRYSAVLRELSGYAMKSAAQKQALRCLLLAWIVYGLAIPVFAQSLGKSESKWEVEVHFGRISSTNSADGTVSLPQQGATFTTVNGGTSRMVSSWYFGDGSALLNQVQALEPSLPGRITPLDPVLATPLAMWQSGIAFGARLSRTISSRMSAELTLDYGQDRLGIPSGVASQEKLQEQVSIQRGRLFSPTGNRVRRYTSLECLAGAPSIRIRATNCYWMPQSMSHCAPLAG
jgi:hypothetical protein